MGKSEKGFSEVKPGRCTNLCRASSSVGFAPYGKRYLFPASLRATAVTDRHVL
jgi:hypothetical protein